MKFTRALLQQRQPMIKFLGKRTPHQATSGAPQAHPAAPTSSLPESFAQYREKATQHGPLKTIPSEPTSRLQSTSVNNRRTGSSLGSVKPQQGQYFDRSELPRRFQRTTWTLEEMEAIESGGASMWA